MMQRYPAPAKLNLFLHVTGRRADGYHLLQTVFRLIDLCDWIEVAPREDNRIVRASDLPGVTAEADLVVRAATLLRDYAGVARGATLSVEKHIPMSTVAASELGLQLGADVPFFLCGANAWAEGVGEALTPIELPPAWYVVISPGIAVQTAEIFAARELTRDSKPLKITSFFAGLGRNDLEPVVRKRFPQVAQALDWLKTYGDARMSGSGSSVFAAFENEAEARTVLKGVPREWHGFAAQGLNRHPFPHN